MKSILSNQKKIGLLKEEFAKSGTLGMPMGPRLFLFLVVLVLTIILGVIVILLITGTFTAGLLENERLVKNELLHASQGISQEYGQLSIQAAEFSKRLSESIEEKADQLGISVSHLQEHPDMLEKIISGEYERALFSLQIAKSSGVFFILDATVNPTLDNAHNSRAGLYIRNMEPNIINALAPNIIVFRGFPSISRQNSLSLHAQWQMEFDISHAPYYHLPLAAASSNTELPLSQLYYWCPAFTLPGTSEEAMLCSVPLIDSNGNVFGVCGFEISDMLFKLSHIPNNSAYNRLFCVLSPIAEESIAFHQSMFAGGYSAKIISKGNDILKISDNRRSFYTYRQEDNNSFLGIHTPIHLYPEGSVFSDEQWTVAIMIPERDFVISMARLNLLLIFSLMLLVVIGITIAFIMSRRFLQPIAKGFDIIKSANLSVAPKTRVPEIDHLIDFLKSRNEELYQKAKQGNLSLSILDEFLENIQTLSPSERAVFNLYVEGHTAKEAAEILYLSINTIKTHNKRIYMKLNVASREELILYITMLKEIGKEID